MLWIVVCAFCNKTWNKTLRYIKFKDEGYDRVKVNYTHTKPTDQNTVRSGMYIGREGGRGKEKK